MAKIILNDGEAKVLGITGRTVQMELRETPDSKNGTKDKCIMHFGMYSSPENTDKGEGLNVALRLKRSTNAGGNARANAL